jgi:hypothetical protein
MLLNVLSREGDGCRAMQQLDCATVTIRRGRSRRTSNARGSCSARWWDRKIVEFMEAAVLNEDAEPGRRLQQLQLPLSA